MVVGAAGAVVFAVRWLAVAAGAGRSSFLTGSAGRRPSFWASSRLPSSPRSCRRRSLPAPRWRRCSRPCPPAGCPAVAVTTSDRRSAIPRCASRSGRRPTRPTVGVDGEAVAAADERFAWHRDRPGRAARGGDPPRSRAPGRSGAPPRRGHRDALLSLDTQRMEERHPCGPLAHPGRGGGGATPARARPARRRPAAADRPADQARADHASSTGRRLGGSWRSSPRTSTPPSMSCARSRRGSIRPSFERRGSSAPSTRRRAASPYRPPSTPRASAGTPPRSRAPSTSAVSRRCRTRQACGARCDVDDQRLGGDAVAPVRGRGHGVPVSTPARRGAGIGLANIDERMLAVGGHVHVSRSRDAARP